MMSIISDVHNNNDDNNRNNNNNNNNNNNDDDYNIIISYLGNIKIIFWVSSYICTI